jgi:phenylalanyl-tRNA synthetase beta chain
MKVPYSWLAEWLDIPWAAKELGSRLTMAGFELDALEPAAPGFTQVVVAEILSAERHPQADKLQVCQVAAGGKEPLQIVCGAPNARAGLRSALAQVGAQLPEGPKLKAAKLRGVESRGMLCSSKELGLSDGHDGILELPADAPVGEPLRDYLKLDDITLELNVTPNRGDAMSIIGIAREVAALAGVPLKGPAIEKVTSKLKDTVLVHLDAPAACPRFAGCVLRGVNNRAATPVWMRERLRRAGVRSISPVVDVTNYVLLELGQPMHAYDLKKLKGEIRVRMAKAGEPVKLLDGRTLEAQPDVLLITDRDGPVGMAGIMGGEGTSVSPETTDVFFEVAYFAPEAIMGRARRFGLQTDASQRYERGIDPSGQERAIARAVALLRSIAGGEAGLVVVKQDARHLPKRPPVRLRKSQLERLLGTSFPDERVHATLEALQMQVSKIEGGWEVIPPAYRFDISIEADLIEEVARIVGLDAVPEVPALTPQSFRALPEECPAEEPVLGLLAGRGYQEAITLAFVDPVLQNRLFPDVPGLALANPIASDQSVMRVSLWPGLLRTALENQRRQQDRIRLFEHGTRFRHGDGGTREIDTVAGLAAGPRLPEQWGLSKELRVPADFFDVKADVEALLAATGAAHSFTFEAGQLSCLHPGRTARILRGGKPLGWLGELHPMLVKELDFVQTLVLFEIDFEALAVLRPEHRPVSRFPHVRRDLALVLDEGVALSTLTECVVLAGGSLLKDVRVFDVYRGTGLEPGRKSVALGLIFQDISRTLTEEEVARQMAAIVAKLQESLNAKVRE